MQGFKVVEFDHFKKKNNFNYGEFATIKKTD